LLEAGGPGEEVVSAAEESSETEVAEAGEGLDEIVIDQQVPSDELDLASVPSNSTGTSDPALPAEPDEVVGDDLSTDEATDSEGDEASEDEIHDLALAFEKSGLSPQGHEVTSRPSEDDQGESIRIVTEAIEQGGPSRSTGPAAPPPGQAQEPSRQTQPHPSNTTQDRGSPELTPPGGDES
jgi:transcription termination/antitermination protein NusA